jgi:hypothetical protein
MTKIAVVRLYREGPVDIKGLIHCILQNIKTIAFCREARGFDAAHERRESRIVRIFLGNRSTAWAIG